MRRTLQLLLPLLGVLLAASVLAAPASASEGNFLVHCDFDQAVVADPIGNAMHIHDFGGAMGISNNSTPNSLLHSPTTCQVGGETPGVWHPAIIAPDGSRQDFTGFSIYYRNIDAAQFKVMPFPFGFKELHGNPANNNPNAYAATWQCRGAGNSSVYIPTSCPAGTGFQEQFYFPSCWDGLSLDAPDHHTLKPCDAAHPIHLPAINLIIQWPQAAVGGKLTSDIEHGTLPGLSAHADYWYTLNPFFFTKVVERCLNAGIQCRTSAPNDGHPTGTIVNFSSGMSPKPTVMTADEALAY